MKRPDYTSQLPKVEQPDLLALVFEETQDPQQNERWRRFAATNPILAREVISRCNAETKHLATGEVRHFELQRIAKQVAVYAIAALEEAAARIQQEPQPPTAIGGVDDVVPIPSASPRGDQPTGEPSQAQPDP